MVPPPSRFKPLGCCSHAVGLTAGEGRAGLAVLVLMVLMV